MKNPHIAAAENALSDVVEAGQSHLAGAASLYRVELAKAHALVSIAKSLDNVDASLDSLDRNGIETIPKQ